MQDSDFKMTLNENFTHETVRLPKSKIPPKATLHLRTAPFHLTASFRTFFTGFSRIAK
jgi:hypothetical protein